MNPRHLVLVLVFSYAMVAAAASQNQVPASTPAAGAQNQPPAQTPAAPALPPLPQDANQYVRQAIQNELAEQDRDHTHWRYHIHREDKKYNYDRDVIETREGEISRTLLWNGQPLTPELRQKDDERMRQLLNDPAALAKHVKRGKDDDEKARRMLHSVSEAFNFEYDGEEDGLVRLKFTPNPRYDPPNREQQVFHSLAGRLWIDRASNRLARIDGSLVEDVTFAFGLLGRLNKGGTFKVVRQDVGYGHWDFISLDVNMTGHAVIFASISVKQRQLFWDFRRMPDTLTLSQAYEMLQKGSDSVSATNGHTTAHPQGRQ
jgi:hypothetical protein